MALIKDAAERRVLKYVEGFVKNSKPARLLQEELDWLGTGLFPLVDHITVRTTNINRRVKEFTQLGFKWDKTQGNDGILEYGDWWAKVYRKPGLPAVFLDQAFEDDRGKTSVIPPWVRRFGDRVLHHIAVRVENIDKAVAALRKRGVRFAGPIVGPKGADLRQVFTMANLKKGHPFTVVEIIERHRGYNGFSPPSADKLMKSSLVTRQRR